MNLSPFFRNLRSAYQAELDDLTQDSEGKNVLRKRLADKRKEIGFLAQMIELSPEMVAVVFHQGFRFTTPAALDKLVGLQPKAFPDWATLSSAVTLEPWAHSLAEVVLRQPGVLMAVGDTLVAGLSGRLVGMSPDTGLVRWESPIASARGTNDVERLVELVAPASRAGYSVCARAFQAGVGCVDVRNASVQWTQKSSGAQGLDGDSAALYGTQSNGAVTAWRRSDGEQSWTTQRLAYRQLTAPLLLGRSVVVGDESGLLHLLSREDGSPLTRLQTDGSGIATHPVEVAGTLVAVTRKGRIYGFRPD